MTPQNPQISPDGAYWWDGQAWRPMPAHGAPAPVEPGQPELTRPSWLPDEAQVPGAPSQTPAAAPSAVTTQDPIATASELPAPVAQMAAPEWMPQAGPSTSRNPVVVAGVAVSALVAVGGGLWAWEQSSNGRQSAAGEDTA